MTIDAHHDIIATFEEKKFFMANTYSVSLSMIGADQTFGLCELDTINYSVAGGNVLSGGIFVVSSSGCSVTVSSNGVGSGTETGTISGFTGGSYFVTWRQLRDPEFGGGGYDEVTLSGNVTATQSPAFPSASNYNISTYATSQTVPIFGGSPSTDAYSLCLTPGLTTNVQVVNDRIDVITLNGAQSFTVSGGNLPDPGQLKYYYIYSYRYDNYCGEQQYYYASSFYIFRPFIPPSTSATCANTTIAFDYSGSLTLPLLNADFADEAYRLCRTSGPKTFSQIAADQIGSTIARGTATSFTIIDSELPASQGGVEDYTVYAYRYPDAGGQGVYVEAGTFYVTRDTAPIVVNPPTDLSFSIAGTESATTTTTVTGSGGSGDVLQVSNNNLNWYANGTSFSVTRGTTPTFYARRVTGSTVSSSYSESVYIPYLPTNLSPVSVSNYFAVAPTQTSQSVPYSGGVPGHDYQLRFYSPVAAVDTVLNSTSGTFTAAFSEHPIEGQTIWYTVAARRTVAAGGSATSYGDTGTSLYISRRFATPSDPIPSNGGEFAPTVSINLYLQNNSTVVTNPTNAIIRQFVNGVVANTQTLAWTGNGTYSTAFTQPRDTGGNTYQYNVYLQYKPPGNTGSSEIIQIGLDRWAYTYSNTGPAYNAGYIPPDRFITFPTSISIEPSDTSVSIPLTGASASTIYRIYDGGTLLQTISGSTGAFSLTNAQLPTSGSSKTYTIYCLQPTADGGDGVQTLADGNISPPNVVVTRQNYIAPANATCANQQIAYNYSGSLVVNVINASFSTDAYRLCRTGGTKTYSQIVADQIGSTITPTNGRTTFTIIEAELPSQGVTEDYTIYAYRYPEFDGAGVYVEAGTFTVERLAQGDVLTNFVPALASYTEGSGTQTVNFSFTLTNPTQSTYYWQIVRDSGTNEGEFSSATAGSVTTSSPSFSVTIANNNIDETGSQGETFHAELFYDSGRTQQVGSDSSQFTLFDNDLAFAIGAISPSSTLAYDYGYPDPVTVQVTNNGQSGLQPNSRIYNVTKGVVAYAIADLPNPATSPTETYTLNLSNDNALPDSGTTNTYRLDVWNGQALVAGPAFTISREGADTTPNPFDLGGPITNSDLSTNYFSNVITVAGLTAGVSTSISISGTGSPAYSKNGGGYTSSSGTVVNGDTVRLRVTSSASQNTTTTGTLNIGGVTDSFSVTTVGAGSGGGTIPSTDADYGIEVYNLNGTKTVLSPATRYGSVVAEATFTLQPKDQANDDYLVSVVDMSELTTSNSGILILTSTSTIVFTVAREAGGFRISNNDPNNSYLITAVAVRY